MTVNKTEPWMTDSLHHLKIPVPKNKTKKRKKEKNKTMTQI